MILKHGLESMIVNILVYIEGREDVEGVAKIYFSWDRCITPKDWKEVCSTDSRVNMDDGHDSVPIGVKIRLDNPHSIVWVRVIKGLAKVMDECTRIKFTPNFKQEK